MHLFLKCLRNYPVKFQHYLRSRSFSSSGTGSTMSMSTPQPWKKERNSNKNINYSPEDTEDDLDDFNLHACKKIYEKINNENHFVVKTSQLTLTLVTLATLARLSTIYF